MIDVAAAIARVLAAARPGAPVRVALADARGRVLASDLRAPWALPAADLAALDGFAVRAAQLASGTAVPVPVATGARLPPGTDAVVRRERAVVVDGRLSTAGPIEPGTDVRRAGEDARAGATLLHTGDPIDPAALAVLAAFGHDPVDVFPRPRVAVLTVGDELVDPARASPEAVTDVLATSLVARIAGWGAECVHGGRAPDDLAAWTDRIGGALPGVDVLVTAAGASRGDKDHTRGALAGVGVHLDVDGVALRPGRPFGFGTRGTTLVFALPGNPRAAAVCAALFVRPAIDALSGRAPAPAAWAALADPVRKRPGMVEAAPARLSTDPHGRQWAHLQPRRGSGLLTAELGHDALALLPAEAESLAAGDVVPVVAS